MKTILVAIGNPLRGDDAVAHRVRELLGPLPDVAVLSVIQLTPELAEQVAGADRAIFIDADVQPGQTGLEALEETPQARLPLGHAITPSEVVALARRLYNFGGEAWLCRIPVSEFNREDKLTREAEAGARTAARLIREHISQQGRPAT